MMRCVVCQSEDVPTSPKGTYYSKSQIPIIKDQIVIGRIRIDYHRDLPLCKKCRRDLVIKGLAKLGEENGNSTNTNEVKT